MQKFNTRCFMKYIAPAIIAQHNALKAILGEKGVNPSDDHINPMNRVTTAAGYESDE